MAFLPSFRQLQYLVVLAEHRHFTKAAEACFVSQSTLSAGIKELEQSLGVLLFERDRQHVALSLAGEAVLEKAKNLLAAAGDLGDTAKALAEPQSGLLRLGMIPTIAPFVLPDWLEHWRQAYPKLSFQLREAMTHELIDDLKHRRLDAALLALPIDEQGLQSLFIHDDELWLVGKAKDPIFRAKALEWSKLSLDRLLLLQEGHCLRDHSLAACGERPSPHFEGVEASSLLTLIQMAQSDMGMALLPELAVKSGLLRHRDLIARPLPSPAPRRQIAFLARPSSARWADLQALAQCIQAARRQRAMAK
ncbi:MAG: hydrogen peroxide-inducible genes activator [Betaproteobacteria bacterium]|nr:LysR family transcriptional regulator [Pseudomonadota bacterium]NBO95798.1 hydrogen peroxide-inducible genes activator [Betaproteobacteria bacterium]HAB47855.1 LysR family transcriptional regulator [Lautropia sp.]NBP33830.1 hydrogen peroxide-inducible genes activator [Betaproteobacteria bacterium]NBP38507.1 hydrogen peroxide-inducible genes activator [Betaproteobacteria bacterium]